MKINATDNLTPLPELARRVAAPAADAQDAATFTDAAALTKKLAETADVRAEAVARAQSLIAAPTYPPEKTIRSIAALLALNLKSDDK